MRHRKHNYVIGFGGEDQCIYGKDVKDKRFVNKVADFIQPMTKDEAEFQVKKLDPAKPIKRYVFKLVPVKCID